MKVLLDECVPWPMHKLLPNHHCTSTQHQGWAGIKNGELIRLAKEEFDLFVTSDQNLRHQQNASDRLQFSPVKITSWELFTYHLIYHQVW